MQAENGVRLLRDEVSPKHFGSFQKHVLQPRAHQTLLQLMTSCTVMAENTVNATTNVHQWDGEKTNAIPCSSRSTLPRRTADDGCIEVARTVQQVYIGYDVESQIDPLHCSLHSK